MSFSFVLSSFSNLHHFLSFYLGDIVRDLYHAQPPLSLPLCALTEDKTSGHVVNPMVWYTLSPQRKY